MRQSREERNDREENRYGAAQTDPRNEGDLRRGVSKGEQAQPHRQRPRCQHKHRRNGQRRCEGRNQGRGRDEQTQHEEQDDLAEPGKGIERLIDDLSGAVAVAAEDQTRQIDCQESARTCRLGAAEAGGSTGERQDRI